MKYNNATDSVYFIEGLEIGRLQNNNPIGLKNYTEESSIINGTEHIICWANGDTKSPIGFYTK